MQQSMVVCQGEQCGYCTPGFVVAMSALYETRNRVTEKQVRDRLPRTSAAAPGTRRSRRGATSQTIAAAVVG